jgi:chromosomal replication initiation ATPase DnaA
MNMFRDKSRAFYNIGKTVKIEKIPAKEMTAYLESRFKSSRIKITKETIEYILEITENIPYYVQYTASELWQNKITEKGEIRNEDVIKAVNRVIESQMDYYLEIYSNLTGNQKALLIALSKASGNIFSKEYMVSNNLSTVSSTQRSIQRLVESEIIEKHNGEYTYSDPFFKKFIELYICA